MLWLICMIGFGKAILSNVEDITKQIKKKILNWLQ